MFLNIISVNCYGCLQGTDSHNKGFLTKLCTVHLTTHISCPVFFIVRNLPQFTWCECKTLFFTNRNNEQHYNKPRYLFIVCLYKLIIHTDILILTCRLLSDVRLSLFCVFYILLLEKGQWSTKWFLWGDWLGQICKCAQPTTFYFW